MKELFLLLFFSKTILLTPAPVDVMAGADLRISASIKAITSGASIQIQVPILPPTQTHEDLRQFDKKMEYAYRPDSVKATLTSNNGASVTLPYKGNYAYSNKDVFLILSASDGMPTDITFEKIEILSTQTLRSVQIYWVNSGK